MNRIIIDEYEMELKDIDGIVEIKPNTCHIHLHGKNRISKLGLNDHSNITITLEENAILKIETYWQEKKENLKLIINSSKETNLDCKINVEVTEQYNLDIQNNIIGNNNKSKIEIHVVTEENGTCKINATGYIKENTKDNELTEILKGITAKENTITFIPNLITDSNDVIASHNATIKSIEEEELFYLKAKGINEMQAIELIKNGFLNKYRDEEVKNES